jgi:hypothetical protein
MAVSDERVAQPETLPTVFQTLPTILGPSRRGYETLVSGS